MRVVLDTNVLVSALLTPFGDAARVLDVVIRGDIRLLLDDRVLSEYRDVLVKPKLAFRKNDVGTLLDFFEAEGIRVNPEPIHDQVIHADDLPFLEVAVSGEADALITGNKRHLRTRPGKKFGIVSPDEFIRLRSEP